MREVNGGEADGCGGVAADGFGENVRRGNAAQFAADGGGLFDVSDGPEIARREKRSETRDCLAQHGFVAGDIQKLFGRARAAARPEACAASAGEKDGAGGNFLASLLHGCVCGGGHGCTKRDQADSLTP